MPRHHQNAVVLVAAGMAIVLGGCARVAGEGRGLPPSRGCGRRPLLASSNRDIDRWDEDAAAECRALADTCIADELPVIDRESSYLVQGCTVHGPQILAGAWEHVGANPMRAIFGCLLLLALIAPNLSGCGILEPTTGRLLTLHVGPQTVDCVGFVPQQCLWVKERPTDEWTYFYDSIRGFDFEPGYLYVLQVRRRSIRNPPADGSSYEYHLLRVISKEPAPAGWRER